MVCLSRNSDACTTPDANSVQMLSFMHGVYINGCLYAGLCAALSAASIIVTIKDYPKFSEHPCISCYSKGIYNKHPTLPKNSGIWGIFFVLDYYNSVETNDKLKYKDIIKKTVMHFMISGCKLI